MPPPGGPEEGKGAVALPAPLFFFSSGGIASTAFLMNSWKTFKKVTDDLACSSSGLRPKKMTHLVCVAKISSFFF
jgi:hypothetical protein